MILTNFGPKIKQPNCQTALFVFALFEDLL